MSMCLVVYGTRINNSLSRLTLKQTNKFKKKSFDYKSTKSHIFSLIVVYQCYQCLPKFEYFALKKTAQHWHWTI